ncbi:hypothetical protein FCL40_10635 [Ferrimonas sediminicola]|uniref:Tetratricopeptide repeat-containing protein n=1 Tax=Ferrimonas sediminicola TaxID=2569538 RepID=A0A4U1BCI6_9GAMM|nr:hypothetical protein [Ferrimonas sediminicola]TKB48610.1 hypothetical protein FCL40_10635 [Ferrimonas sediminicola]
MRYFWVNNLIRNSLGVIALLGVSSLMLACSSLPPEKRSFQREIDKALSGSDAAATTVAKVYCRGEYYKLFKTYKNPSQCVKWVDYAVTILGTSGGQYKDSGYLGEVYFWTLSDLIHGDMASHYDAAKVKVIEKVEAIRTDDSKRGLWLFYNEYSRHDKDKSRRTTISKEMCDKRGEAEYCSYYADRLYDNDRNLEALKLYEKSGTSGAESKFNLSQLYLHPPKGRDSEPEKALTLMKSAYVTWLNSCDERYGASSTECVDMKGRRDARLFEIQAEVAFKQDVGLDRSIRLDKYKVAVTHYLKSKKYFEALVYFDLLERMDYQLPASMSFFKAEAYFHTDETDKARSVYQQYLNSAGKKGAYYRTALERLNEINAL